MPERTFTDLDLDFFCIVAATWTLDEVDGWSDYAQRVEAGETELRFP